jgi:hypothetical protein
VASGALAAPRDTIENQAEATPAWIERDRRAAERGDLDAQYRLVGACRWIWFAHNLWAEQAASNGEFIGVLFIRFAAAGMTEAQLAETESRAKYNLLPYE